MLGKSPDQQQTELFKNLLVHQLNPKHARYLLSHAIAWKKLAEDLAPHYGRVGLPSRPIRKMAALLMLTCLSRLKKAKRALKRLRTLAGCQMRDLQQQLLRIGQEKKQC